jgi:hypothetical protein
MSTENNNSEDLQSNHLLIQLKYKILKMRIHGFDLIFFLQG